MKKLLIINFCISILLLSGCINTSIGFRSVMISTSQKSETDGKITNVPLHGHSSVDAAKETKFNDSLKPTLAPKLNETNYLKAESIPKEPFKPGETIQIN